MAADQQHRQESCAFILHLGCSPMQARSSPGHRFTAGHETSCSLVSPAWDQVSVISPQPPKGAVHSPQPQQGHKGGFCVLPSDEHFSRAASNTLNSPLTGRWQNLYQRHGWSTREPYRRSWGRHLGAFSPGSHILIYSHTCRTVQLITT